MELAPVDHISGDVQVQFDGVAARERLPTDTHVGYDYGVPRARSQATKREESSTHWDSHSSFRFVEQQQLLEIQ